MADYPHASGVGDGPVKDLSREGTLRSLYNLPLRSRNILGAQNSRRLKI